jgi:aminopeptidase N
MLMLLLALQAQDPLARTVDPVRPDQNILHYDVHITLPDTGSTFAAVARVHFRPTVPAGRLVLDLTDSLTVTAVSAAMAGGRAVPFTHAGNRLVVDWWGAVGDSLVVEIAYGGRAPDALAIQPNVHGHRTAFADDWPDRAHNWLPVVDHPSDKATIRWTIDVPATWRAIANGRFVDRVRLADGRLRWRYDEPHRIPAYTFVVGAGRLAVTATETATGVPQGIWTFPEDSAFAVDGPFRRVNAIVDTLTAYIGPFPYTQLAHVESSTRFGGMENASAIFYTERGYASRRMGESVVVHETAHQWFGDAVTERDWHHLWLSEGFATYFTALFYELAGDTTTFRSRLAGARATYLGSDVVDRPVIDVAVTDYMRLLNANSYQKGGWILHMLRRTIGDDAFRRGIRDYYATYRDSTALSSDLRAVMEQASHRDLGWFFRQWLTQPGYPQLTVTVAPAAGVGGQATVTLRQTQPDAWGTFRIPVRVEVVNSRTGERSGVTVEMTGRTAEARLAVPAAADRIEVDPAGEVLLTAEAAFAAR